MHLCLICSSSLDTFDRVLVQHPDIQECSFQGCSATHTLLTRSSSVQANICARSVCSCNFTATDKNMEFGRRRLSCLRSCVIRWRYDFVLGCARQSWTCAKCTQVACPVWHALGAHILGARVGAMLRHRQCIALATCASCDRARHAPMQAPTHASALGRCQ